MQRSAEIYDNIPLCEYITAEHRAEMARALFLDVNSICNARNPVSACREKYAEAMLALAEYQVLIIPPPPEDDVSGLRGQPGITGNMNAHLLDLFRKNDHLRGARFDAGEPITEGNGQALLQRLYWEHYWSLETMLAARVQLGDSVDGDDWHKAFLHAACVNAEHTFRWNLELSPAFDESIAREASNAYSMFTDIVMSGARDPAAEWHDYYRSSGIPMPDFSIQ